MASSSSRVLPETKHFHLEQVADGVFAAIIIPGTGAQGNAAIVDLGDHTLIFDTFLTAKAAVELREMAELLLGRPVTYVVNSHYHLDHVMGNQVFFPHAIFIATNQTRTLMENDTSIDEVRQTDIVTPLEEALAQAENEEQRQRIATNLAENKALADSMATAQHILPNFTFENTLVFHGSKRKAELITHGGGHTKSDAFLYLPAEKLALMGDLLFVQSHAMILDGDPREWQHILERVKLLDLHTLVPGHGPVGSKEDMDTLQAYLQTIEAMAQSVIRQGGTLEDAKRLPMPPPFDSLPASDVFEWNMEFLFEYLKS